MCFEHSAVRLTLLMRSLSKTVSVNRIAYRRVGKYRSYQMSIRSQYFVFAVSLVMVFGCTSHILRAPAKYESITISPLAFGSAANCSAVFASVKNGMVPAKFTYLGKGAELWRTLMQNSNSVANEPEVKLLSDLIPGLLKDKRYSSGANVIDIGPGDGGKALEIINLWPFKKVHYLAIDISRSVIEVARKQLRSPKVIFEHQEVDLELEDFKIAAKKIEVKSNKPSVFFLLGQTIGNPPDIVQFLSNVRRSMSSDSILVVGLDLYRKEKVPELIREYSNPAYLDMDLWLLREIGLNQGVNGHVVIDFDYTNRDIRGTFVLDRDIEISNGADTVLLRRGQRISFFRSHRFSENDISEIFKNSNLNVSGLKIDPETNYALVIAKPE